MPMFSYRLRLFVMRWICKRDQLTIIYLIYLLFTIYIVHNFIRQYKILVYY